MRAFVSSYVLLVILCAYLIVAISMHTTNCISLDASKRKNKRTNDGTADRRMRKTHHLNVQLLSLFFQLMITIAIAQYFVAAGIHIPIRYRLYLASIHWCHVHVSLLLWLNAFLDCIIKFLPQPRCDAFVSMCAVRCAMAQWCNCVHQSHVARRVQTLGSGLE